jgi:hypothetical protein
MAARLSIKTYLNLAFAIWLVCVACAFPNGTAASSPSTLINTPIILDRGDQTFVEARVQRPANKRVGIVVMLQGSGCGSEQESFKALVEAWEQKYALMYIAKPGSSLSLEACNDSYLRTNTIQRRVADMQIVIAHLRSQRW